MATPHRDPPIIEIISQVPPPHRMNEDQIGRITADAWTAANNTAEHELEMSDQDQQALEHAALSWPTEKKLAFLKATAEHWMRPYQDESSWWHGNNHSATVFLYCHADAQNPPREPQELHELQREIQTQ